MEVKQIYTMMNDITKEIIGSTDLVKEDLSNITDVGKEILGKTDVDNYVKSLVNHIGKVVFTNRPYSGSVPSVLMDAWEFGSILEKVSSDLPEAVENESYNLEDKKDYSPNIFYKPSVSAKFFNKKVTFEIDVSFTEYQVKESFSNAEQLNGFISMLLNNVDKAMTVKIDSLIMRTINNMIAETISSEFKSVTDNDYSKSSGIKAVNLLKDYNAKFSKTLTTDTCLQDKEFIKYCVYVMGLYTDRLSKMSTLFNVGGKERFTPKDNLHIVLLTDYASSTMAYLESDTYHNEMVKLPTYETVPYWQGTGKDYGFDSISRINVTSSSGKDIAMSGIIGVMFDSEALGVSNLNKRVTTNYNAKADFFNNFYKFDAGYFNDLNENFVVFFVA